LMPLRPNSMAKARPTGPAPTIKTSVVRELVVGVSMDLQVKK